ncbi:MAG: hypothetical protein KAH23_02095, partial [Kiritimatiellae bacterium]|nr:hypothetical protein [Kiritimatiellia bacterium]
LLNAENLSGIPPLEVGDDAALLQTLERAPLTSWKTRTDALLPQFGNVAQAATRLLEPNASFVRLSKGTFNSEADIDAWWAENRRAIVDKLKDGPVML